MKYAIVVLVLIAAVAIIGNGSVQASPSPLKVKMIDCYSANEAAKFEATKKKIPQVSDRLENTVGTPWILESTSGQKCLLVTEKTEHSRTATIQVTSPF